MILQSSQQTDCSKPNGPSNHAIGSQGRCRIYDEPREADRYVARQIANLVKERAAQGKPCVLGLATGSTPVKVYAELIRIHKEEKQSFANVITFNLDEYFSMQPDSLQSYHRFMHENLFNHIDIPANQIHIPDGTIPAEQVFDYCTQYEQAIASAGGLDIQLLGIGRTGHIGFNEPGSRPESRTRLITLDAMTRIDAASAFFGIENVPRRAITMGVATILQARRIFLLAYGEGKSGIIAKSIEGEISSSIPATYLQNHPNCEYVIDTAAAAMLSEVRTPWIANTVVWDDKMLRKAVVWLAQLRNKPILTLTNGDYNENHLQDLLAEYGSAYEINLRVFRYLQDTITGWPAGKPGRPNCVFPKRAILFSPHPDDDVISMGGTLKRLATQGHEVHIAYQTSGNIAVFDDDAIRFTKFAEDFSEMFGGPSDALRETTTKITNFVRKKGPGDRDIPELKKLKGLIRRGEAIGGAEVCGVPEERLHFLDLPFYETGAVRKKAIGDDDVQITVDLLRKIKPHQIYAAGDLSDPHGTHRTCLDILMKALELCKSDDWYRECEVLLYRGAWQEWPAHEIEVAVPLSPQEVDRKREAIFRHESQKDRAMFPGTDAREFWQRAEERNAATARMYDKLGLAQYQAIEGFVKWKRAN
jgi:glucosamine-6-phosphate deaminase